MQKLIKRVIFNKNHDNKTQKYLIFNILNKNQGWKCLIKPKSELFELITNKDVLFYLKAQPINLEIFSYNFNEFLNSYKTFILTKPIILIDVISCFNSIFGANEVIDHIALSVFFEDWFLSEISNTVKKEFASNFYNLNN